MFGLRARPLLTPRHVVDAVHRAQTVVQPRRRGPKLQCFERSNNHGAAIVTSSGSRFPRSCGSSFRPRPGPVWGDSSAAPRVLSESCRRYLCQPRATLIRRFSKGGRSPRMWCFRQARPHWSGAGPQAGPFAAGAARKRQPSAFRRACSPAIDAVCSPGPRCCLAFPSVTKRHTSASA